MSRLNVKLIAGLMAAAALLAVGVHFLHGAQVRRNAAALLRKALQAEADGRPDQTLKYLGQYLAYDPDNPEALARYGLTLDRVATTDQAREPVIDILERVLRKRPGRHDVRGRLARLLMAVGRWNDGAEHLQHLQAAFPDDPEVERLLGECLEGDRQYRKAADWFARATQHDPKNIPSYVRHAALLLRRLDDPRQADAVMDALVKANDRDAHAYLARAKYRMGRAQDPAPPAPGEEPEDPGRTLNEAADDMARARELAPDDADVLLAAADLAGARARQAGGDAGEAGRAEARKYLEHGIGRHPQDGRLYRALADLELRAGRRADAVRCLERALAALPEAAPECRDLRWGLAELLIAEGKPDKAGRKRAADILAALRADGYPRPPLDYLDACLLVEQGKWPAAARALEQVRPHLAAGLRWQDLVRSADLLLSQCYGHLNAPDRQYAALMSAGALSASDPAWAAACRGRAAALAAMDKIDDALEEYRKLGKAPEVQPEVARLLILRNLRLPKDQRNWDEVEAALAEAARSAPDTPEATVLRAEALLARYPEEPGRARDLLTAARDRQPARAEYWVALASLADREGKTDTALGLLDGAGKAAGDRVELRLARAGFLAERGTPEDRRALTRLAEGAERLSADDRQALRRGLAEALARAGANDQARALWEQLAADQPDDLTARLKLFDLALRADDEPAMEKALAGVRRVEGGDGPLEQFATACRLVWRAKRGEKSGLGRARSLLADVAARRPAWPRVAVCAAEIDELEGDGGEAIGDYLRAIDGGERNPAVVRRAVELLYERGRYFEADQLLRKLPDAALLGGMQRVAVAVSLHNQDYDRAVALAERAVAADSKDYRDYLWLAEVLAAAPARRAEAEAFFRRALKLAGDVPDPWVALVQYLARTDLDKAEAVVHEAEAKLPKEKAALALAQCYEAVRRADRAEELYQAALAAKPDDVALLRAVATFHLRHGRLSAAKPYLRRIVERKGPAAEDGAWAQLTLAFLAAVGGDYLESRQALQAAAEGGPDTADKRHARAVALAAQRGRAERKQAIALLEGLAADRPLAADDQFLLGQLYESVGDWRKAQERMLSLLAANPDRPQYLAHFARSLLRRKDVEAAQPWLAKLEKLDPKSLTTLEVRAWLLKEQGHAAEAAALLTGYAAGEGGRPRPAAEVLRLAGLLERWGRAEAEGPYRQYAARGGRPECALALAQYLGRHDRTDEALGVCERAWGTCPAEAVAGACVAAAHSARATAAQRERVGGWLEAALRKEPGNPNLAVHLAALRTLQGRYPEAESLYRQVAEGHRPQAAAMALNNLAWLLALRSGKADEALRLAERAIALVGPEPGLLDTRAVACLKAGQLERAAQDLEAAVAEAPMASAYFHLAQVRQLQKDREAAAAAWREARALGLATGSIDPLERPAYEQLAAALATP